ncbi:OLC1v1032760C1 [Oldenlandia corymbosa var. corymbosa]|uniref:Sulfotransferase n=1 Tax=Oldenlandia corymbosa var. corymbosa TaxID=529605 RepID=A0AAV1CPF6_OLDCO|nr:OLC1v1032760C1 [Oldenlandia corymbosa var. corymbosa]
MASDQESPTKETNSRYDQQELISKLPKAETGIPAKDLYLYKGFWHPRSFLEGTISLQQDSKPINPTDIILCSAPKAGFTWLKSLCYAIITRDQLDESSSPLLTNVSHSLIPYMEIDLVKNPPNRNPEFPLLSTHSPFTSLPESVRNTPDCKIIYICRDPKDTLVSQWHYIKHMMIDGVSIEFWFDRFREGKIPWGPYWDHVLGYWKASIEMPEKVLFLKYEDLKKKTSFCVKRLAEFMGKPFSHQEEVEGLPEKMVKLCSFENLSNLEVNKVGKVEATGQKEIGNGAFFRKGIIGDWKNCLTSEMIETLDRITREMFTGSDLVFD